MSLKLYFKILIILIISINCFFQSVPGIYEEDNYENYGDEDEIESVTPEPRIVGGYRPNNPTLTKYIVSLRYRGESKHNFGYTHFCAGSIIAANKILTAAHCLYRQGKTSKSSSFKVVAKTPLRLKKTTDTQEINIQKIIIHPKYSEKTMFHDIALLILKEDIIMDTKFAAKISLPKDNIQPGRLCTVIGWGKLYMNGPLANEILYADLYLHSRKDCRRIYPNFSGKKICASDIYDREKDACLGDSGGPLICNGILTGIVSYGYGCASGNEGIYTNVFKYIDWINSGDQETIKSLITMLVMNIFITVFLN